jgi:hypothetical protein
LVQPGVNVDPSKGIVLSSRQSQARRKRSERRIARQGMSPTRSRVRNLKKSFDERHIEHQNNTPIS